MAGQGIRKLMRCLRFSLGIVVAFSGSLFLLMDGACPAQAEGAHCPEHGYGSS